MEQFQSRKNVWCVEHQIDPLKEAAKKPVNTLQMLKQDKSVLIASNNETSDLDILKTLTQNKLVGLTNMEINADDKKNTVVDCIGEDDVTEVAALLKVETTDARVSRNGLD